MINLNLTFNLEIPFGQNHLNINANNSDGIIDSARISITDSDFNLVAYGILINLEN